MRLSIIVAMDRSGVIGREGELPWHLPDDLKRFKRITMGKPIIMGRRTHESIGRPLPGRRNIVLSSRTDYAADGCEVQLSVAAAMAAVADAAEAMVIGGAALYAAILPQASRIYLTEVDAALTGDVHFPVFDRMQWTELSREAHAADARHAHAFTFLVLERAADEL